MAYPYIIQGSNIVVVIDNHSHTVSKTHPTYANVLAAIKANDWAKVKDVIEPKKVVLSYGKGNVSIQGEQLYWRGNPLNGALASRMISMLQEGLPIEPMVNFMHNLMANPSKRAVDELYGFLEKNALPITPDGHFLAFKKVRANYMDCHSGTFDNSVGQVCEMERNLVDDDKDRTCSAGLHFCSQEYLKSFGGERTMIVKINPADVVSIPTDYNNSKGRACRYTVIGEMENQATPEKTFTSSVQSNGYDIKPQAAKVEPRGASTGWPFPGGVSVAAPVVRSGQTVVKGIPQEYDANGTALSMTKDAIRKRRARAAKRTFNPMGRNQG